MIGLRDIIKNTLGSVDSYAHIDMFAVHLIEITFLEESNKMNVIHNESANPIRYGLTGLTEKQIRAFINDRIKINERWVEDINNTALIDVHKDNMEDIIEAMSYNIALQTLFSFFFYLDAAKDMPDGINEAVEYYFSYWPSVKKKATPENKKAVAVLLTNWSNKITNGRLVA